MDNDITNSDSDTADLEEEIDYKFSPCQHVHSQPLGPKYILHVSCTSESNPYVAVALSDYSCEIFSVTGSQLAKIAVCNEHSNKLVNCKFSSVNNNLLYTGSSDGSVKLWDLRGPDKSACTFTDTTTTESTLLKALSSFDVTPCDRLLAAGTDLTEGDAYILFWDVRNPELLGAYWESHTDDITQVKFHPEDSNRLMSGSTDGLINTYDLAETSEDDALQECLNTEAFVEDLLWFNEHKISCITSTHDLQLWEIDGAEPYKRFNRDNIASQITRTADFTYLTKVHPIKDSLMVMCGSTGKEGNSLRSLLVSNGKVTTAFQFRENKQRVRASWMNEHTSFLVTGGEKGNLDIWKPDFEAIDFKAFRRK